MAKTRIEVKRQVKEKVIRKNLPKRTRNIVRELAPNQTFAAQLWSQGGHTKREIAEECRMSMGTFCALRKDPLFKHEVKRRLQIYEDSSKEERLRIVEDIKKPILREIQNRIKLKKGLVNIKLPTLMNFLKGLNEETRLDSPDGITSKVAHGRPEDFELDDLRDLHRDAVERKKDIKKISKLTNDETLGLST